jgi:Peptidase A4 family
VGGVPQRRHRGSQRGYGVGVKGAVAGLIALATLAAGAASAGPSTGRAFATRAGSDAQVSSNWAGYALTGTNPDATPVTYTNVTGTWVQPKVTCTAGQSYSAFWVGLGGFAANSQALEQIGTESNCTASGKAVYAAWYEIIPAPSIPIRMKIRPGDRITAAVLVQGTQVILQITNRTTHVRVTKRVTVAAPDLTSAEWIAEAPSECTSSGLCQTLPLANFGAVAFTASATTGGGHAGTISDPAWTATPIELSEDNQSGVDAVIPQPRGSASGAVPGALSADGRGFSVVWHPASA